MKNYSISSVERIKNREIFDQVFKNGYVIKKYPLKVIWSYAEKNEEVPAKMGVCVSRRRFKQAVRRNYIKRRIKEAYRQNKTKLSHFLEENNWHLYIVVVYVSDKLAEYERIEERMNEALDELMRQLKKDSEILDQ